MPQVAVTFEISRPIDDVFGFFAKPTNLLKLAPPDLHLELLEAPAILQLGSRLVWRGRRFGVAQKMIQEVTSFELSKLIAEEQKQGPFGRWSLARHFATTEVGTSVREEIHFEPPGGMLGFMVTADFIRKDLDKLLAFRETKLKELFG